MVGITRVYGTCNGAEFEMTYDTSSRKWLAIIPKMPTGTYVVDFYAVDCAGNEAYYSTVIIEVDFDTCEISFRTLRIDTSVIPPDVPLPVIVDPNRYDGGSVRWT